MKLENWTDVHIVLLPIYRISTCTMNVFIVSLFSMTIVYYYILRRRTRTCKLFNLLLIRLNILYTVKYVQISISDHLSFICLYLRLSICYSVCPPTCLSPCLSASPPVFNLFTFLTFSPESVDQSLENVALKSLNDFGWRK